MLAISDSELDLKKHEDLGIPPFQQFLVNCMRLGKKQFDAGAKGMDDALSDGDLNTSLGLRVFGCLSIGIVFVELLIGEVKKTYDTIIKTIDIHIQRQRFSLIK